MKTDDPTPPNRPVAVSTGDRFTFFRQSGWMMIATTAGGVLMFAVHKPASRMPGGEYSLFNTLLSIFNLISIPSLGLASVFAQHAAAAITETQRQQLAGTVRGVLRGTFVLWLVMALAVFLLRHQLVATLHISNPAALWATLLYGLVALWLPVMMGVLQGLQNFLWLGWTAILHGVGRFVTVTLIVLFLGGRSAGAMTGALLGAIVALAVCGWNARQACLGPGAPINWREWLGRVVPLSLGLGASMFMLSVDMIMVRSFFSEDETHLYAAASKIGFGLVQFTAPLTAVMFPKIVQSAARAEKTNVLFQAFAVTALIGGMTSLVCTLFPTLPLRFVFQPSYLKIAWLVPWSAWAMLPLALANVLINNLLARAQYAVVPWLLVVAAGYATSVCFFHESFLQVIQVLGTSNLVFLGVSAWFTWGAKPQRSDATG